MVTLRRVLVSATLVVTAALATACGGSSDVSTAKAQSSASAPAAATSSAKPMPSTCASDPAGTTYASPEAVVPRVDGIFVGYEDRGNLVVLRYYPDNTVYLAVVPGNTPVNAAKSWVQPSPRSNTGPFQHDASGAFTKPIPAGDISYSVWKYTGDSLILHSVSHHGCRESSTLMKFIVD